MEAIKDKTKIYLDLSKLSEDIQRKVIALLPEPPKNLYTHIKYSGNRCLIFTDKWVLINKSSFWARSEISLSEFLEMMGESEEYKSEKERINSDGTLYIGEGLENYYKEQLERTGKFKVVSEKETSEEVLQVENDGWNVDTISHIFGGMF